MHASDPSGMGQNFGTRVAAFGNDVVVGTQWGLDIFVLDGVTGEVVRTIPQSEPSLGGPVITTSRYIIHGMPREDNVIARDAGYVYVHDGLTGALVSKIRHPVPTYNDRFGGAVAATQSSMLIAAAWHADRTGTTFLYANGPTASPVVTPVPFTGIETSPNPFQTTTAIAFSLARREAVALSIHDVAGRLVRRFDTEQVGAGSHVVAWDGRDGAGASVGTGVYFVRLEAGGAVRTGRVVRLR